MDDGGTTERDDDMRRGGKLYKLAVHLLVALATFGGGWWLFSLLWPLFERTPVPAGGTAFAAMALALGAATALLWAVFVRSATLPLFRGSGARQHAFMAAGTGLVLMLLLFVYELRMTRVAGQEAELVATMDENGETTELRDPERLTSRIEAFYGAMGSRDVESMHSITQFPLEQRSSGDPMSDWGLDEQWTSRPKVSLGVRLDKVCTCHTWSWRNGSQSLRCLLLLSGTAEDADGQRGRTKFLETWEHVEEEWYGRCPGPAVEDCPADPYAEGYCRGSHPLRDR